jgi:hypothetical protein
MRAARLLVAGVALVACADTFDPSNEVQSVRVLAIRADQPYARPGSTVTLDLLAVDGRTAPKAPMRVGWLPVPCVNPPDDAFYGCFPAFAALPAGVDLADHLVTGPRFAFTLPADVITSHAGDTYGVAFAFAVACAGHVEYRPPARGASPDAVPFACLDDAGNALGPDDFVFTYATVYAFADRTNDNPAIDHLTYAGSAVDPAAGIAIARCTQGALHDCPKAGVDIAVPASSQEVDPTSLDANGAPLREAIWVDYFVLRSQLAHDTVVLYDARSGAAAGTSDDLYAPQTAGDTHLWAVVRDDRGGVTWLDVPVHVP